MGPRSHAAVVLVGALVAAAGGPLALGAEPSSGTLSPEQPEATWAGDGFPVGRPVQGEGGCAGPLDPQCDHFAVTIDLPADATTTLAVEVDPHEAFDDLDIHVFDASGQRIGGGNTYDPEAGGLERAVVADLPAGDYTLSVQPFWLVGTGSFGGSARLVDDEEATEFTSLATALREPSFFDPACVDPVPDPTAHLLAPDATATIDVLLLLDGIGADRAAALAGRAAASYEEIGLDVAWSYDDTFEASSTGSTNENGGPPRPTADADTMFAEAKAHVGGTRPEGIDAVVVLTAKELGGLAGVADCIGGVRYPDRGFALSEAWHERLAMALGLQPDPSAYVLAHELGHVVAAHHHYGHCTYGVAGGAVAGETCTLMLYVPGFSTASLHFSALNAAVVRSAVLEHARP